MFLDLLYFSMTNYFLAIAACSVIGYAIGNINSDTQIATMQAKSITNKLYLLIVLCITLIRVRMGDADELDAEKYMMAGTVGTLLFRECVSNVFHAYVLRTMKKEMN